MIENLKDENPVKVIFKYQCVYKEIFTFGSRNEEYEDYDDIEYFIDYQAIYRIFESTVFKVVFTSIGGTYADDEIESFGYSQNFDTLEAAKKFIAEETKDFKDDEFFLFSENSEK